MAELGAQHGRSMGAASAPATARALHGRGRLVHQAGNYSRAQLRAAVRPRGVRQAGRRVGLLESSERYYRCCVVIIQSAHEHEHEVVCYRIVSNASMSRPSPVQCAGDSTRS
jgi:hypothetical protein